ncbi:MAG TPA: hypothetical protein DCQ06_02175 [Myxococcales bacterium]|nr:hypothetical protein [Myxococcales bacterium]
MDLLAAIVPGRTYILFVRGARHQGTVLRKNDRLIEMSCDGQLLRLDARSIWAVLEPSASSRGAVA